jgi:two-component system, chemotaxis family, CheB/CheR fusion protein
MMANSGGSMMDVHEEGRVEFHALATALSQGRRASDASDAVIMHDLEGRILAWNHGAERMYGYTEDEALEMNIEVLVPDAERPKAQSFLEAIRKGEEVPSLEVKRRAKGRRILDVWLTTTKLIDENGTPVAVATTERDITDRKQAAQERERLIQELKKAVEARDEFPAIASHELRNPLSGLMLKLDILRSQARRSVSDGPGLTFTIMLPLKPKEVGGG